MPLDLTQERLKQVLLCSEDTICGETAIIGDTPIELTTVVEGTLDANPF